ncbi:hypothetical protein [Planomicrobium sp. MB-3u-38]|uniref:hypothetical protein n=1 Tax=Planomicrobium sp. MB-3u-38 TaxID=2058318 RepID=UPI001304405E|nr:hypothetical protein [Planomicrobium sp. MB-3u-38]
MNEKYEKVIAAIPHWTPSRDCRIFGVSAIQSIVKCTLLEAIEIRDRLEYEGAIPNRRY